MDKQGIKTVFIFILAGVVWIVGMDYAFSTIGLAPLTLRTIHILKNWSFILAAGLLIYFLITSRNNERKAAQTFLKQFSVAAEQIVESILVTDKNGIIEYVNPAFEKITGYTREEVLKKKTNILKSGVHDDEFYKRLWNTISAGIIYRTEFTNRKKNGELFIEDRIISPIKNEKGEILYYVASGLDITEHKKMENELKYSQQQLRNLTANLHSLREQESARIAREIHDELGQSLTGLKIDLVWILKKMNSLTAEIIPLLQERVYTMSTLIDTTIQTVRRISTELRPSILDDLGLAAAIEWQAQEFEKKSHIQCELNLASSNLEINKEYSTTLFRIFQEALMNIVRHADATYIFISLYKKEHSIHLEISDNGKGITNEQIIQHTSLGILGMKERAHLFGGSVLFEKNAPKGTRVIITLPLSPSS